MRPRRSRRRIAIAVLLAALAGAPGGASAQSRSELDVALSELQGRYDNARRELHLLEQQLPRVIAPENPIVNRKAYADRVLALRALMDSLAEQRKALSRRVAETPSTPPRFRLVAIKGPSASAAGGGSSVKVEWSPNAPGATMRWKGNVSDPAKGNPKIMAASLKGVPTEIILGQPIEFGVQGTRRNEYIQGSGCNIRSWGGAPDRVGATFYVGGIFGGTLHGKQDLRLFCDEAKPLVAGGNPRRGAQAAAKQDTITATVRLVPTKVGKTAQGYPRYYHYRIDVASNAADAAAIHGKEANLLDFNAGEFLTDQQGFLRPGNRGFEAAKKKRLRISIAPWGVLARDSTVVFEYAPLVKDEPFVANVPPFVEPPDFGKPTGFGADPGGAPAAPSAAQAAVGGGQAASLDSDARGGTSQVPGIQGTGPGGAVTFGDLRPGHPAIAGFMREWLAAAEPPENARPGYRLRYNNRGNKVGTAPTGTMRDNHAGSFNADTLWSSGRDLPSLDHCMLGDYVLKRVRGESTASCQGRRTASSEAAAGTVPRLAGLSVAAARAALERAGLEARLRPGRPAPDAARAHKIEGTQPAEGARLRPGDQVTLLVHAPPVAQARVPDVTRRASREARATLEAAGFKVRLRPGPPARGAALAGRVAGVAPAPGTVLAPGSTVTLTVHAPPLAQARVPNVIRAASRDAAAALARAGFKVRTRTGSAAPNRAGGGTVERVEPAPGTVLAPGAEVTLVVYGGYVPSRTERIRDALAAGRLQCPRQLRGSVPRWDDRAGRVACDCPRGEVVNRAGNACERPPARVSRTPPNSSSEPPYIDPDVWQKLQRLRQQSNQSPPNRAPPSRPAPAPSIACAKNFWFDSARSVFVCGCSAHAFDRRSQACVRQATRPAPPPLASPQPAPPQSTTTRRQGTVIVPPSNLPRPHCDCTDPKTGRGYNNLFGLCTGIDQTGATPC